MPDFSTKQRENLAEKGQAMPSGAFPIRNRSDLKRAIQAFGRSKNPEMTKKWIIHRAKELDAMDLIPEKWLEHSAIKVDNFLIHYGIPGMRWGKRQSSSSMSSKSKRRIGSSVATVVGGAAGVIGSTQGLKSAAKFITSKKVNDRLVSEALKNQNALVKRLARKKVSETMAAKANILASQLTTGHNKQMIIAGSAIAGALLVGGATLATIHAVQNRRREKQEEREAKE